MICTLFLYLATPILAERKLIFVESIWRHGDRAPIDLPYPNDPYNEDAWPRGFGHLTNLGMQQVKELGSYFYDRYKPIGFISDQFDPKKVFIRSSDSDRALTSAQTFIYGLYPAVGKFQFEDGLKWQPVPIHSSTPGEADLLCKPTKVACPRYDQLVAKSDAEDALKYNEKYFNFFEEVGPPMGLENASFYDINGMFDVSRELVHNLTDKQPSWVFKKWEEYGDKTSMDIVLEMRTARMNNQYDSDEKSRIYGGYLLKDWIQNALSSIAGTLKYNTVLYSSHDGTLLALLNALGIGNQMMIPYAAAVILEVYRDETNSTFVEVLYRNESNTVAYPMTLPYCAEPCSVQDFARSYQNMTVDSLDEVLKMCQTSSSWSNSVIASFLLISLKLFS